MKFLRLLKMAMSVCVLLVTPVASLASEGSPSKPGSSKNEKQAGYSTVVVNGRALTGPNSSAQASGGRIMIPAAAVARALGDSIAVNALDRSVKVSRQTGVIAIFESQLGHVRENGAVILTVSTSGEINFPPNADEMMLPMEIASTLFDASIRFESVQNRVLINSGASESGMTINGGSRGVFEIYQAEFEYNLSKFAGSLAQNLILNATGRLGDGRFYFNSNSSGSSFRKFAPRTFSLNLERPNGQRFIAGDFGSGAALPLLTANVRGGLASVPIGSFTAAAFVGRSNSGTVLPILFGDDLGFIPHRPRPRFDTTVFGGYLTTTMTERPRPLTWSAGAMRFAGDSRSGTLASSGVNYAGSRLRMQADIGFGNFDGFDNESRRIKGSAAAVDLTTTLQLSDELSVHARYAKIGQNFLSPQSGVREPLDLKAAGVSWSPAKWLSAQVNASTVSRPGRAGRSDSYVTAAFGITPGAGKPRFFVSHTQNSSALVPSGSFTLINASKDFSRWRLFANATRIEVIGPAMTNVQFGTGITLNDRNSFEVSQGAGSNGGLNGVVDWRSSGLFGDRLSLSVGGGYNYSRNGKITAYERVMASLTLPRRSSLQVTFMNTNGGPTVLVQLRGTLFRKRESVAYLNSPIAEVNNFGSVSGRVYQDIDGNGRFDAGTDKPLAGVKVRIDGNRYVETDANGLYLFDAVTAGEHKLYLDLLTVRADLTLLDVGAREFKIGGGQSTTSDFRLVRTGRVTGRVWFDANGNGEFDEGETPLADVRIMTASGRDTLSDANGFFTIADLVPGEHLILIDEKTLPEKVISGSKPYAAQVFAGRKTGDIRLAAIPLPAEIKRFGDRKQ